MFHPRSVKAWFCLVCAVQIQTMSSRHVRFGSPGCLRKSLRVGRQFDKITENIWETQIKNWPQELHGKLHWRYPEHIRPVLVTVMVQEIGKENVSVSLENTKNKETGSEELASSWAIQRRKEFTWMEIQPQKRNSEIRISFGLAQLQGWLMEVSKINVS